MPEKTHADLDSPWKDALERFFEPAMLLYFPDAHREIDWSKGVRFLDKELQRIRPRGAIGRRTVDMLAEVCLRNGTEVWILVHIEVQGQPEAEFPLRMYRYSYRIFDKFGRPVASFAVLTDPGIRWRPRRYRQEILGSEVNLRFPIVKLVDFRRRREELESSDNPFAAITLAQLAVLETAAGSRERLAAKLGMVRRLRRLGLDRADIEELFRLIDWMVHLDDDLQLEFDEELWQDEQEGKVAFVSSIERRGMEKGRLEGRQEGQAGLLILQLEAKFGPLGDAFRRRITEANAETLREWGIRLVKADRLDEVFH